jgi:hypothetical protein
MMLTGHEVGYERRAGRASLARLGRSVFANLAFVTFAWAVSYCGHRWFGDPETSMLSWWAWVPVGMMSVAGDAVGAKRLFSWRGLVAVLAAVGALVGSYVLLRDLGLVTL